MPLSVAKNQLESDIKAAFDKAFKTGHDASDKDVSSKIREDLAKDLMTAIHAYVTSAQVDITSVVSTVPPGVAVVAPPPGGTGATISPGIAQHAGVGQLL